MSIHIVSHTHWDREWYKPFQYFNVKLSYLFDRLFTLLKDNPNYKHFMLDGQMVMIEDYLHNHPEKFDLIKQYVLNKRLIIGPWYSQPDEFAPSGESLIRNLLIGIRLAHQFGEHMPVGYVPDAFGHNAQLPHLLKGFNIDSAVVMRGVPTYQLSQSDFIWKALNGDEVTAVSLPKGYSNAMFLPKDVALIEKRIEDLVKELKTYGAKDHFLVMDGVDHQFPVSEVTQYIENNLHVKHASLEDYIATIDTKKLDVLKGELITPFTNRVHLTMASTRMRQKKKNRESEHLLIHQVEPSNVLTWLFGAKYQHGQINLAWKTLLKNHIHDSICGCCIDDVHTEMDQRFLEVKQIGETLTHNNVRALAYYVGEQPLSLIVLNDAFVMGKHLITADVYTDTPSFKIQDLDGHSVAYVIESQSHIDASKLSIWSLYMGVPCWVYKTTISFVDDLLFNFGFTQYQIIETDSTHALTYDESPSPMIENDALQIRLSDKGSIDVYDKLQDITYTDLCLFEDSGDAGDTYNYSPPKIDTVISSQDAHYIDYRVKTSDIKSSLNVSLALKVPRELNDKQRSLEQNTLTIDIAYTLYAHTNRIDIDITTNNTVNDHRLRVLFKSPVLSKYSYAEVQNGIVKRKNKLEETDSWQDQGFKEQPLPIYPMQRFVYLKDNQLTFLVLNKDLTEYEIIDNEWVAITLFRSVGMMGKADLAVRPGRPSGIPAPTPQAQELGCHSNHLSLMFGSNLDDAFITREASRFNADIRATQNTIPLSQMKEKLGDFLNQYNIDSLTCDLASQLSGMNKRMDLIKILDTRISLTSIKKAEQEDAMILRLYNPTKENIKTIAIESALSIDTAYQTNLLEDNITPCQLQSNHLLIESIHALSTVSVKITYKKL